jgi:hypothetical protein
MASLLAFLTTSTADAWEFYVIEGRGAGTLNACAATQIYRDAFFTVRLYAEEMDFVFQNDEFTLPFGEILGPVELTANNMSFLGAALSFDRSETDVRSTTSVMQIIPRKEDAADLFDALRAGTVLAITFPSGDNYQVELNGSARALNLASECWRRIETGPDSKNPFAVPDRKNPFEAAPQTSANPFEKPI